MLISGAYWLSGLTHIMAHQQQIGVEGKEVILNCKKHDKDVTWKYEYDAGSSAIIIQILAGKIFKGKSSNSRPILPNTWLRNLFPPKQAYFSKRQSSNVRSI